MQAETVVASNSGSPFHPNTAKRAMAETIAAGV
jgi:hypothetical protein